jgi:hypothetical protein
MQELIHTKYKSWDYFQDKIACHSLFIHNPATALEPNMIKQAKHKTDTQTWHKEHDPEHHGERRRIESSYSRIVPEAEHGPAAARTAAAFWQHQQCAAAEIIGQMVQDPNQQPATKAMPVMPNRVTLRSFQ